MSQRRLNYLPWVLVLLVMLMPILIVGVVISLLPFSFGVKYALWMLLLVATIVAAMHTAYKVSKTQRNR